MIGKPFFSGKNPQEDSGCLEIEYPKSIGIIELTEVGESLWLKATEDFKKAEDKVFEENEFQKEQKSDDLLLQIAEIEAEWNALIVGTAQVSAENTTNSFDMEPIGARSIAGSSKSDLVAAQLQKNIASDVGQMKREHGFQSSQFDGSSND